jgi:hypothetical protein
MVWQRRRAASPRKRVLKVLSVQFALYTTCPTAKSQVASSEGEFGVSIWWGNIVSLVSSINPYHERSRHVLVFFIPFVGLLLGTSSIRQVDSPDRREPAKLLEVNSEVARPSSCDFDAFSF